MTDKELKEKAESFADRFDYTDNYNYEFYYKKSPYDIAVQAYIAGAKDNGIVWHKVEDKLPPHDDNFIKNVSIPVMTDKDLWACYYPDEKEWYSNGMKIDVVAWCDFPGYKRR